MTSGVTYPRILVLNTNWPYGAYVHALLNSARKSRLNVAIAPKKMVASNLFGFLGFLVNKYIAGMAKKSIVEVMNLA